MDFTRVRTLHVGNVSFQVTEEDLKKQFSQYGSVLRIKMPKHKDGTFKGFAFIEMGTKKGADLAIREMHGLTFMGRAGLQVQLARESTQEHHNRLRQTLQRSAAQSHEMRNGPSEPPPGTTRTLFIGNVDFAVDEDGLKEFLVNYYPEQIRIPRNPKTGFPKGCAFVVMRDPQSAQEARENLNGVELGGRLVRIRRAEDKNLES